MIAESSARALPAINSGTESQPNHDNPLLSIGRVVASLQVLLATRRAARNEEHAYWYTIARGM